MTIDDLPYVKMPYDKMLETASFVDSINRMEKSGKMVLSFSCSTDGDFDVYKKNFIDHYEEAGGEIFETVSCLPGTIRMNLELDINKTFDSFDTFTDPDELEKAIGSRWTFNAITIAISRKLKVIVVLSSNSNNRWAWMEGLQEGCGSFSTKSFGYYIETNLSNWLPQSLRRKLAKQSIDVYDFKWHDEEVSRLTRDHRYSALTAYAHDFKVDLPVVSSRQELILIQPFLELLQLQNSVKQAQRQLDNAKKLYKDAENRIEEFMVASDLSI